jgi:hypothetical protein
MHVDLGDRQAQGFFNAEFDPVHYSKRNFGNARASLDDDEKINIDLMVIYFDIYTAPKVAARQRVNDPVAQILVRHADDAVAFKDCLPGETGNGVRRNFDST